MDFGSCFSHVLNMLWLLHLLAQTAWPLFSNRVWDASCSNLRYCAEKFLRRTCERFATFRECTPTMKHSRHGSCEVPASSYSPSHPLSHFRGHLSAAADSKTSPRNPVMCIVLHLENIASLDWILNCKFRPLNSQPLAVQSQ